MALSLSDKQVIVTKVHEMAKNALSVVVADPRGVTVEQMTSLRKTGRQEQVFIRMARNALLKRAVQGTEYECLQNIFIGPSLIAFSQEHPGAAARLFKEFSKSNPAFTIKAAAFEKTFIEANQIDRLALLPTREQALARLMFTMKEAIAGKLARTLVALRNKMQQEAQELPSGTTH